MEDYRPPDIQFETTNIQVDGGSTSKKFLINAAADEMCMMPSY
jgi:hypothetical protein